MKQGVCIGWVAVFVCVMVISLSLFGELQPLSVIGHYGGSIQTLNIQGDYAYAGQGLGFVIFDISGYRLPHPAEYVPPAEPARVGSVTLEAAITGIAISNGFAYIAAGSGGLVTVSVSDPQQPQVVHGYQAAGMNNGVAAQPGFVFAIWDDVYVGGRLLVFNTDVPESPELVTTLPLSGHPYAFELDGSRAYVACESQGPSYTLEVINISSPEAPALLGSNSMTNKLSDFRIEQNMAFLLYAAGDVAVMDASDPQSLSLVSPVPSAFAGMQLDIVDGTIYATFSDWTDEVFAVKEEDRDNTDGPTGRCVLPDEPLCLKVEDGLAFVGTRCGTLQVYDVSYAESVVRLGGSTQIGTPREITVLEDRAYLVYRNPYATEPDKHWQHNHFGEPGYLEVLDTTEPAHPALVGSLGSLEGAQLPFGGTYDAAFTGNTAIIVSSRSETITGGPRESIFEAVNLEDPAQPQLIGALHLDKEPGHVVLQGNVAYVMSFSGVGPYTLSVIDISNPAAPLVLGSIEPSESVRYNTQLAIDGNRAYAKVARYTGTPFDIDVIDISDPESLKVLARYSDMPDFSLVSAIHDLHVKNNVAFLEIDQYWEHSTSSQFQILNVGDLSNPVIVDRLSSKRPHNFRGFDVAYDTLYLTSETDGLSRHTIGDDLDIDHIDSSHAVPSAEGLVAKDGFVYTVQPDRGVLVFDEHRFPLITSVGGRGTIEPSVGERMVNEGEEVFLQAIPDDIFSEFFGWDGDVTGDRLSNPITFVMDSKKEISAHFREVDYVALLEMAVEGSGTTNPAPGLYVDFAYAFVEIEAIPDSGWRFDHWEGDVTGEATANPTTVYVDECKSIRAVFIPITHTLMVSVDGQGTTSPAVGVNTYHEVETVTATATPTEGWVFDHWEGDVMGDPTENPITITMEADKTLTAVFTEQCSGFGCAKASEDNPAKSSDMAVVGLASLGLWFGRSKSGKKNTPR